MACAKPESPGSRGVSTGRRGRGGLFRQPLPGSSFLRWLVWSQAGEGSSCCDPDISNPQLLPDHQSNYLIAFGYFRCLVLIPSLPPISSVANVEIELLKRKSLAKRLRSQVNRGNSAVNLLFSITNIPSGFRPFLHQMPCFNVLLSRNEPFSRLGKGREGLACPRETGFANKSSGHGRRR